MELLTRIWSTAAPPYLRKVPSVDYLRQTWIHQFWVDNGNLRLREAKDLPPAGTRSDSPYDPEARYGNKRSTQWTGYKVHITESCDEDRIHLATHVITLTANVPDVEQTEAVHQAPRRNICCPKCT